MDDRTEICISIDTEFSIAGHFDDPENKQPISTPVVTCPVDGKEEGLGFLLDTFQQYETSASFFIECANCCYFGDKPMQAIVDRIKAAGQDMQLHVHPVWLSMANQASLQGFPRNDNCAERSFEQLKAAFSYCIDNFERLVGHKPNAIRTGSLWADENVYKVMESLGIPLASNIGMGIFKPKEQALQHYSGRHLISNVMEVPVFTYQDFDLFGKKGCKSLQITSCSWPEMRHILLKARKEGVKNIMILTHPFEFVKRGDYQFNKLIRNRVNQQRLVKLCQFIAEHDQDFVTTDFTRSKESWAASELQQPYLKIPSHFSLVRKLHNKINDLIWHY